MEDAYVQPQVLHNLYLHFNRLEKRVSQTETHLKRWKKMTAALAILLAAVLGAFFYTGLFQSTLHPPADQTELLINAEKIDQLKADTAYYEKEIQQLMGLLQELDTKIQAAADTAVGEAKQRLETQFNKNSGDMLNQLTEMMNRVQGSVDTIKYRTNLVQNNLDVVSKRVDEAHRRISGLTLTTGHIEKFQESIRKSEHLDFENNYRPSETDLFFVYKLETENEGALYKTFHKELRLIIPAETRDNG